MRLRYLNTAIWALIVIIGGLLLADYRGFLNREFAIPTEGIGLESGRQYRVENVLGHGLHPFLAKLLYSSIGDSPDNLQASTLLLLENGRLLGFPHANHQDITDHGGGRYSYWFDTLHFSTTDDSDPRVNGRVYSVVQTPNALRLFIPPLLLLISLLVLQQLQASAIDLRERAIGALVVIIGGLLVADYTGLLNREFPIPTEAIRPESGFQYRIENVSGYGPHLLLATFIYSSSSDSLEDLQASTLLLRENGRLLGFSHAAHQDITENGGGLYSHWLDTLHFSTSDNSDPRMNGRAYSVVQTPDAFRLFGPPLLLLFTLLTWRKLRALSEDPPEIEFLKRVLRSRILWYGATISLCFYIIWLHASMAPDVPVIYPDSTTYWRANDTVPLGYPAFLWCIYTLFGSLKAVAVAQITLFSISILTVQAAIERVSRSPAVGGIAAILIVAFGASASAALWILSESLFISILLFHVAAAAWAFVRPTRLNLGLLALTAVLAVSVRPAGYFLFGGIIFLCLFWSGQRLLALRSALIPLIAFTSIYYSIGYVVREVPDQINASANLFPHIVSLVDADSPGVSADIHPLLNDPVIAEYRLARERNKGDWNALQHLEQQNFNRVLAATNTHIPFALTGTIVKHAIFRHPLGYVAIARENMCAWIAELTFVNAPQVGYFLYSTYESNQDGIIRFYSQELKMPINIDLQHLRTLFSKMEAYSPFFGVSSPYRWPLRSVFILTALTCGVLFAAGRAGQLTGFVAYVSALAFGGALLVSMSTVFIKRYAIPLDPLIIIVVCLGIWRTMTGLLRWGVGCAVPSKRLARADAAPRFGE